MANVNVTTASWHGSAGEAVTFTNPPTATSTVVEDSSSEWPFSNSAPLSFANGQSNTSLKSGLQNGTYYYQLSSGGGTFSRKGVTVP